MADEQEKSNAENSTSDNLCEENSDNEEAGDLKNEEQERSDGSDVDEDFRFQSQLTEEQVEVLQGQDEFAKALYNVLARKEGNIFFSPLSIHAILSLAAQGSGGQTKEALSKVLSVSDIRVAAEGYKGIMEHLNSVTDILLLMANSIFLNDNCKLQETFKTVATQNFFADVQSLDFEQQEDAANFINSWVEKNTNKKITDLIDPATLGGDISSILVNAIYFKGQWAFPFKARKTVTQKFYLNDNETVDVQMMKMKKDDMDFKIDEYLDAKILALPYYNYGANLIIILPNKINGISELEEKLAKIYLNLEDMDRQEVTIYLPKFKIEQTIDLKESLTEMGLGDIFSPTADFSDMVDSSKPLYVNEVIQKTFFEVDEVGSEAAAVTAGRLMMFCAPPPPEEFRADHPFIIMLQVTQEYVRHTLFIGRISNP